MKYFSNILATTIVALFLLSFGMKSAAVGQVPHCDGDPCVDASNCGNWVQQSPMIVSLDPNCPACTLEIHYKYRDNSSCINPCPSAPPFEFQIDFVISDGTCFYPCNGNPPKYNFGDLDNLYMLAVYELTKLYSKPLPPGENCGPVVPNFRGASCKKEYVAPTGKVYIMTCFVYECCVQNLQYCEDSNGNGRLIKTDIYIPYDNCGQDPDGSNCEYSCDWDWEETFLPKENNIDFNYDYDKFDINYTIDNNLININLYGKMEGVISVDIFSSEGKNVFYKESYINENNFELNIENTFSTGSYFMAFNLNGNLIKIENFMIVK